jgi:acetoin utilization deacetylase AcuC-like enzyme
VPLPDGILDAEYLDILDHQLESILSRFTPDLVCYQCGVDVLAADKLGRLGLSLDGCRKRDEMVFSRMHSLDIPVVCAMGGGYAEDIRLIVEAHANTFRLARHYWA